MKILKRAKSTSKIKKMTVEVDWFKFLSKAEALVYMMIRDGKILPWHKFISQNPSFELVPKFTLLNGNNIRARKYSADLLVKDKLGNEIVVEIKSPFSESEPIYRLRRTFFLYKYNKDIKFMEIIYKNKTTPVIIKKYY